MIIIILSPDFADFDFGTPVEDGAFYARLHVPPGGILASVTAEKGGKTKTAERMIMRN